MHQALCPVRLTVDNRIRREPGPEHSRSVHIHLAEEGRMFEQVRERPLRIETRALGWTMVSGILCAFSGAS